MAVAHYVSHLAYLEQSMPERGKNLLSGMARFFPEMKGRLSWNAHLRGSGRRYSLALPQRWRLVHVLIVLFTYDIYAREQDWAQLRGADVHGSGKDFAVSFGVRSRRGRSKHGAHQGTTTACRG